MSEPFPAFIEQMKAKGFKYLRTNNVSGSQIAEFTGMFAGYSDCEIGVVATNNNVWSVSVMLPKQTDWYTLKSWYNTLKDSYIKKYGTPEHDLHFFLEPYYEGDGYEISAVKHDKCAYIVSWELPDGVIFMQISKYCQVKITYEDSANNKKDEQNKQKLIQDDI